MQKRNRQNKFVEFEQRREEELPAHVKLNYNLEVFTLETKIKNSPDIHKM